MRDRGQGEVTTTRYLENRIRHSCNPSFRITRVKDEEEKGVSRVALSLKANIVIAEDR